MCAIIFYWIIFSIEHSGLFFLNFLFIKHFFIESVITFHLFMLLELSRFGLNPFSSSDQRVKQPKTDIMQ